MPNPADDSPCKKRLKGMNNLWWKNAQVKQNQELKFMKNEELKANHNLPDFLPSLLPFHSHPFYQKASIDIQNVILAIGWIIYNCKTVAIENDLISPACMDIIHNKIPGCKDYTIQEVVGQTLVDESDHIYLTNSATCITKIKRDLQDLTLPQFNLVRFMYKEQEKCSYPWQKTLIRLITAIVSEIFISDYLNLLAHDDTINPFNRKVVDIHRKDELAHGCVFKNLTKLIYAELNSVEKEFFLSKLPLPVKWFANSELNVWEAALKQINFSKASEMIRDCATTETALNRIDYSGVTTLVEELEGDRGLDIFRREGII